MESLSSLRRLSRRSLACLAFACFTFFVCAFYTFSFDAYDVASAMPNQPSSDQGLVFGPPPSVAVFAVDDAVGSSFSVRSDSNLRGHDKRVHGDQAYNEPFPSDQAYSERIHNDKVYKGRVHNDQADNEPVHHDQVRDEPVHNARVTNGQVRSEGHINHERVNNQEKRYELAKTRYVYLKNTSSSSTSTSTTSSPTVIDSSRDTCSRNATKSSKLILLWTPFFGRWDYLSESGIRQCSRCRNCRITRDRSKLLESDAVILHARDMSVADLPPVRLPHQRWVFYCLESPPYSDFPGLGYAMNMFNWTMTYRLDSDVKATYGTVYKVRPPRKLDLEYLEWSWSNKTRSVAWLTSHCPTHGGRDEYARELGKYIDLDVFGRCGSSECPPGQTESCLQGFAEKYRFFLAFENTLCRDYVTEKFYRTLGYDIVPVVFGGANYSRVAPPGSYIEALSFKSPRHLAYFLAGVGRNFKLYSSYFRWRQDYDVELGNGKECQLCSLLHRKDVGPSSYASLRDWWVRRSQCKAWRDK